MSADQQHPRSSQQNQENRRTQDGEGQLQLHEQQQKNQQHQQQEQPETGFYVLRPLLHDVPVATEGDSGAYITCVEYWNDNLYIGTSAGEVFHFVSLPPESGSDSAEPFFILASRLPIASAASSSSSSSSSSSPVEAAGSGAVGVQEIQLVPSSNKACILCNGVVSFYELPELSPTYRGTKLSNCQWIGGLSVHCDEKTGEEVPVVMIAMNKRMVLVKIGDEARRVRNIEYPNCLAGSRQDAIACVADPEMYSLLEVEKLEKIPLFPISSAAKTESQDDEDAAGGRETDEEPDAAAQRPSSPELLAPDLVFRKQRDRQSSISSTPPTASPRLSQRVVSTPMSPPLGSSEWSTPPQRAESTSKPLPKPPDIARLQPHIVSPTPNEFLVVTGTEPVEPGVGIFVNMDSELVRGTLEFERYPDSIVIDNDTTTRTRRRSDLEENSGYVLAVLAKDDEDMSRRKEERRGFVIEAQRWDINPGEGNRNRSFLNVPVGDEVSPCAGLRQTVSPSEISFSEINDMLQLVCLNSHLQRATMPSRQKDGSSSPGAEEQYSEPDWEKRRNQEELTFVRNLSQSRGTVVCWSGKYIWRVYRNPLALQLGNVLSAFEHSDAGLINADGITAFLQSLEDMELTNEMEFLGLTYVKQKASFLLFMKVLVSPESRTSGLLSTAETALVDSGLDPRIVLLFLPLLKDEVLQSEQGIWTYNGLVKTAETYAATLSRVTLAIDDDVWDMIKRYLHSWQRKRGYGSITDDAYVFDSVDAALLHLLLELDARVIEAKKAERVAYENDEEIFHEEQRRSSAAIRVELNKIVDTWKGNFERAVELLEGYRRLFVLSRLYQSRKMAGQVLATWKRIVDGEVDKGGELSPTAVDSQVRKYLVKLRDVRLVREYGCWLAARNPKLGVAVFSDESSRVKFDVPDVIDLLKAGAPAAMQEYLEHLVFTKKLNQYTDDLIAYYLDSVLSVLESSPEARMSLAESYSTYRALEPPKPSYLGFIIHNCPPQSWWGSRLRLLQLLGGDAFSQYTTASSTSLANITYSLPAVLSRIEPFRDILVSESIILVGRQGRHHEALRLLVHGLGDYDTAIRFCLVGSPVTSLSTPAPKIAGGVAQDRQKQTQLLRHLFTQFVRIEDAATRVERTASLLEHFAPVFDDVADVLAHIPDSWGLQVVTGYLERVLRHVVSQRRETKVHRALSAGRYLQVDADFIHKVERIGPLVDYGDEDDDDGVISSRTGVWLLSELDHRERRRLWDSGRERIEEFE